jgi:hypothetical protein
VHPIPHGIGREHKKCWAGDAKFVEEVLNVLVEDVLGPSAGGEEGSALDDQRARVVDPGPVFGEKVGIFDELNFAGRIGRRRQLSVALSRPAEQESGVAGGDEPAIDLESMRQEGVVPIEEDQVFAFRERSAMITGGAGATIHWEPREGDGGSKGAQNLRGAIAGAIVDDNDLLAGKFLRQGRLDRRSDKPFVVITSDDDAKQWV